MKTHHRFRRYFPALFIALAVLLPGGCASPAAVPSPHEPIPIDDYILVSMTHEYSFPEKPYPPEYFHADYVERVETLYAYHIGDLKDRDSFLRIEQLILTKKGKKHIDELIEELNARDDIESAGRDYAYYTGDEFAVSADETLSAETASGR